MNVSQLSQPEAICGRDDCGRRGNPPVYPLWVILNCFNYVSLPQPLGLVWLSLCLCKVTSVDIIAPGEFVYMSRQRSVSIWARSVCVFTGPTTRKWSILDRPQTALEPTSTPAFSSGRCSSLKHRHLLLSCNTVKHVEHFLWQSCFQGVKTLGPKSLVNITLFVHTDNSHREKEIEPFFSALIHRRGESFN